MGKPIMKVWDSTQQKYVSVPAVKGLPGAAGTTPHIGANGNWYLGETDTGVKATGPAGTPGKNGSDASVTSANIANALGYTPRKAWYVFIAGTPDAPIGYETPAEIYQAYTDGYAVYAVVQMDDLLGGLPIILPLLFILESGMMCFAGSANPHLSGVVDISTTITVTHDVSWHIFADAQPTIPTALKNPNALTIKIGSTTVTYDGSAAKTVEIADGTEVSY